MYLILYYFIYVCIYVSILLHTHTNVFTPFLWTFMSTKLNGYYFQTYFIINNFCTFFLWTFKLGNFIEFYPSKE